MEWEPDQSVSHSSFKKICKDKNMIFKIQKDLNLKKLPTTVEEWTTKVKRLYLLISIFITSMIFMVKNIVIRMEKEIVYLFLYNPMVYQNGWSTQSVHKTRKSAEAALEAHRLESELKWEADFITPQERATHPFGKYEDWRINAMVIQP